MRFRRALSKWKNIDAEGRGLLIESGFLLIWASLLLLFMPFKIIASSIGKLIDKAPAGDGDSKVHPVSLRIGWAVQAAARRMPWPAKCLAQALAAKWMLNRRRLPGLLYLGVAKNPLAPKKLDAHAWVRSGDSVLTGEAGHERFTVVGVFR